MSASLNKPCRAPVAVKPGEVPEGPHSDGLGGTVDVVMVETTAESRNAEMLKFLQESPHWKRHGGRDHLVVCAWWGAAKSWGKWKTDGPSLWKMLRPTAILGTIDEYFARDWNKVRRLRAREKGGWWPRLRLRDRAPEGRCCCWATLQALLMHPQATPFFYL